MRKLTLEKIRVLDLGQVYAGPLAGRMLADLGAEVIRIESPSRSTRGGPDPQSGATYPNGDPGEQPYNRSAYYNELNRNKLAVSLDLSTVKGREILKRLVEISDIVLENYTPRVMANFELEFTALTEINPKLIMVSISAFGHTGPYRDYLSFGRGIEAMTGLSSITAYPNGSPLGPGIAYADATGGLHAAFAVLVAFRQRQQTGAGTHIDLSLQESLTGLVGEGVSDNSASNPFAMPLGNHDSPLTYQGCYRCAGIDQWIAITIRSESEWKSLLHVISATDRNNHFILGDVLNGRQSRSDFDRHIEGWTINLDPHEAMDILQKSGIAAGAILGADNLCQNTHLKERGFFQRVSHPEAGSHEYPGIGWKSNHFQGVVRNPAPCFAQHNRYVFGTLLGMSIDEIAKLEESGIAGRVPIR